MVCWIANDIRLFRANDFLTDQTFQSEIEARVLRYPNSEQYSPISVQ